MRLKIRQFSAIWIFFFFLFFRPAFYIVGYRLNRYGNYLVEFVCLIMVGGAIYFRRYGYHTTKGVLSIGGLYFWCIIGSSILNSMAGREIDYFEAVYTFLNTLCFILVCDIGLWYSPKKTLFSFLSVGITVCTFNAITMFIYGYSGGMNHLLTEQYGRILSENYFLLGEDNATYFWSWPVLVVTWIYYYKYSTNRLMKWVAIIYTIITGYSYFYMESMLAVAACFAVPGVLVMLHRGLNKEKNKKKLKNKTGVIRFWYLWITGLVFDFLMSIQIILYIFQPIIENVFHKDITLSYRTFIWEKSYIVLALSPIFGFGHEPGNVTVSKIFINHTHNLVMETLYRGGIIGFIFLIVMFIIITKESRKAKESILYKFIEVMVFIFLICCSMEFAYYRYHYLVLLLLMVRPGIIAETIPTGKQRLAISSELQHQRRF